MNFFLFQFFFIYSMINELFLTLNTDLSLFQFMEILFIPRLWNVAIWKWSWFIYTVGTIWFWTKLTKFEVISSIYILFTIVTLKQLSFFIRSLNHFNFLIMRNFWKYFTFKAINRFIWIIFTDLFSFFIHIKFKFLYFIFIILLFELFNLHNLISLNIIKGYHFLLQFRISRLVNVFSLFNCI